MQSLIQVGLNNELEKEIVHINSILNKEIAEESINIAQHFNLAYTQLKIVNKLEQFGLTININLHYPTPSGNLEGGFNIDKEELIYAFMHQESMFNASAKSKQGAMGLMQVLPSTAKFITSSKDVKRNSNILKVPEINLEVGQEYIEYLLGLEIVSNNLIYLAAAYLNGGPGNLKKMEGRNKLFRGSSILYGKYSI